jgi:hypothetical protein
MQSVVPVSSSTCARFLALVLGSPPRFASMSSRNSAPLGSAVLPVYNALGGPQGKGHVTFNRAQSQYLDAGPRTLNIATNGGLTIVVVVRFTGTVGSWERIIDLGSGQDTNNLVLCRRSTDSGFNLIFQTQPSGPSNSVENRPVDYYIDNMIEQNTWVTVVVRYSESTTSLNQFVVEVSKEPRVWHYKFSYVFDTVPDRTVSGTYIGKSWWSSVGDYFNGDMAGVFVVDEYLTTDATRAIVDSMTRGEDLTNQGPCAVSNAACVAGTYKVLTGTASASPSSTCIACPSNSCSPAGSTALTSCTCNAGSAGPDGGPCAPCVAGKYKSLTETVRPTVVNDQEAQCYLNRYPDLQTAFGATNIAEAKTHWIQYGRNENRDVTCPTTCTDCGVGTYSAAVGASASSTCRACPSNSNSPAGSAALTSCTCNAGSTGPSGGPCAACVEGKYQSVKTATVTCSGGCLCQPSSGTSSGTISDGPSEYQNNANCTWFISSSGLISLSFSSFHTESGYDFVTINNCTSSFSCVEQVARLSGDYSYVSQSPIFTSSTGYMQVRLTSDSSVVSSGFVASWFVPCTDCPTNSSSPAGSTALTSCTCNAGFPGPNGGPCTACVAGKYQSVTAATVTCSGGCLCQPSSGTSSGTISDGPSEYENNADCKWLIASSGLISLSFSSFNTESGYDFVTINYCTSSSSCVEDEEVARLSGISVNLDTIYTSNTGYMQVRLTSDSSVVSSGFVASWIALGSSCTDCPANSNSPARSAALSSCTCNAGFPGPIGGPCTACVAGKYQSVTAATVTCSGGCLCHPSSGTSSGTISDGPSEYQNNANCTWFIASSGLVSLSFSSFNTESGYDFVTINNCSSSSSCARDEEVARLSGISVNLDTTYTSNTGYMQVRLTSDSSVVSSGFVASWIVLAFSCTDCPTNSNSSAGSISLSNCTCNAGSPGPIGGPCTACVAGKYQSVTAATVTCSGGCLCQPSSGTSSGTISDGPSEYQNNADCKWLIASSGLISLSFSSFSTESGYDFVTINNCSSSSSCVRDEEVASLSGISVNLDTTYTSNTGYMQVRLTSDYSLVSSGFVASWIVLGDMLFDGVPTSTCTDCPTNSNSSAGSAALSSCTCNAGFPGPTGGPCTACVAGKYQSVTAGTVTCSGGCLCQPSSGTSSGTISDGLSEYQNNADCKWMIVSSGLISLSFLSFNTESGYDFVTIHTCTSSSSCVQDEEVARLSGISVNLSTTYTSNTGYMQVRLTSDSSVVSSGFVASWIVLDDGTATGTATCTDCGAGTYSAAVGAAASSTCSACPSNSNSPARSSGLQISVWNFPNAWQEQFPSFDFGTQSFTGLGAAIVKKETFDMTYNDQSWIQVGAPADYFAAVLTGTFEVKIAGSYDFWTESDDGSRLWIDSGLVVNNGGLHDIVKINGTVSLTSGFHSILVQFVEAVGGVYLKISYSGADTGGVEKPVVPSSAPPGSVTSCTCNAGFSGPDGGPCTACVTGKYKTLTGTATCTDCGAGTYSAAVGASTSSTCSACPSNSNSTAGSAALTSCTCNTGSTGPNGGPCATVICVRLCLSCL